MEQVEEFKPKHDKKDNKEEKPKFVARTPTDIQRIKLEKLMKNPQKEVIIPNLSSSSSLSSSRRENANSISETPSFVRNVMGSSAGAGSGEFHVYRHLRRKEYARQKQIQHQSVQEKMDEDFRNKLEQNRLQAELKTAKKRAKRLKRKQRTKKPKSNDGNSRTSESRNTESSDNDSDGGDHDDDKTHTDDDDNQNKSNCEDTASSNQM